MLFSHTDRKFNSRRTQTLYNTDLFRWVLHCCHWNAEMNEWNSQSCWTWPCCLFWVIVNRKIIFLLQTAQREIYVSWRKNLLDLMEGKKYRLGKITTRCNGIQSIPLSAALRGCLKLYPTPFWKCFFTQLLTSLVDACIFHQRLCKFTAFLQGKKLPHCTLFVFTLRLWNVEIKVLQRKKDDRKQKKQTAFKMFSYYRWIIWFEPNKLQFETSIIYRCIILYCIIDIQYIVI